MATLGDVRDILEIDVPAEQPVTIESLLAPDQRKKKFKKDALFKRPEGMHREVYALLSFRDGSSVAPLVSSAAPAKLGGYKHVKAKLGLRKVRPWLRVPFVNPSRKDSLLLHHWRRVEDEAKEYPFARFNKVLEIPSFSRNEYAKSLEVDNWTAAETEHLMQLCSLFNLRWPVVHDRWDREKFPAKRSIEDLKERYFGVHNALAKARAGDVQEAAILHFDADHERRRKEQLEKLFSRTTAQIQEEERLLDELRKIEARRRERERKAADLQKLIADADKADSRLSSLQAGSKPAAAAGGITSSERKKFPKVGRPPSSGAGFSSSGAMSVDSSSFGFDSPAGSLRFADNRGPGVSLRSQRMKLPATISQKKVKAIEQVLQSLNIEYNPMATDDIASHFNDLRNDIVLLFDLKNAMAACQFEVESLKLQHESLTDRVLEVPEKLRRDSSSTEAPKNAAGTSVARKRLVDLIDLSGGGTPPTRKRKVLPEQSSSVAVKRLRRS